MCWNETSSTSANKILGRQSVASTLSVDNRAEVAIVVKIIFFEKCFSINLGKCDSD
jgi:hypothetical protein